MCGAYAAINNPFVNTLTTSLNVTKVETRNIRVPASTIQIVHENEFGRNLVDAKWWLMLNADGRPNYKYATFNSRSDKLFSSRLTKGLFKTSRCIIPAAGIIEGQNKKYHYIQGKDKAIALGGIYKSYHLANETITTASIITCPGNPQLEGIHAKSIPLMLDANDKDLINAWLNPDFKDSLAFEYLLNNKINQDLLATPIQGARNLKSNGSNIILHAE